MAPVETQEQFELWLDDQPQEVCVAIATRAALRVFPLVTHIALVTPIDRQSETKETLALTTARCILTSGVEAVLPAAEVRASAYAAAAAATIAARAAATARAAAYIDSDAAARHAARSADGASRASRAAARGASVGTDAAEAALAASDTASNEVVEARNATYADTELTFQNLMAGRLWGNLNEPDWLIARFEPNILDSRMEWAFWRRWYQGFLNGKPLDWELQRRVVLIDNIIWESGPEAVAAEIEKIETSYEVETLAASIEKSVYAAQTTERGIGDNNPPTPIADDLADQPPVTNVCVAARELKEQAQSSSPDTGRIKRAVGALVGVLKSVGLWVAGKLDKGITAAVVTAGGAAGTTGIMWLTQNTDKIHELINATQQWLRLIL